MRVIRGRQQLLALLVGALVLGLWWWAGSGEERRTPSSPSESSSTSLERDDPERPLDTVQLADLPPEAEETIERIERGGPFPHDRDGHVFENYEELLPDQGRGYYREYTVPTPGSDDRGARRVVTGDEGEYYWTQDHYQSFERIVR